MTRYTFAHTGNKEKVELRQAYENDNEASMVWV